jgi:serine/threonine protein kinase
MSRLGFAAFAVFSLLLCCFVAHTDADTTSYLLSNTATPNNQLRFQGSAYQGLDEDLLRAGGATVTIQLLGNELSYNSSYIQSREFRQYLQGGTSPFLASTTNDSAAVTAAPTTNTTWSNCIGHALLNSRATISNGGHLLKISLGPASSACTVPQLMSLTVVVPTAAITTSAAIQSWPAALTGPTVVVIPKGKIGFRSARDEMVVSGKDATLILLGDASDLPSNPRFDIVEGTSCRNARSAQVENKSWNPNTKELTFRPLLGGTLSICYAPFQDLPSVVIRASGGVVVNGPEGLTTEPSNPRAQIEFSGMIYGTNLTEYDTLVITIDSTCSNVRGDDDNYDLVLSSPARALFWASVPIQGLYQACYLRQGSDRYVRVGTINMNKGSELIVDRDLPQLLIDQDSLVVKSAHISFLTLQSGQLNVDNFQLNVTHFVWTGGQLTGPGSINCMGTNSKIAALAETRVIEGIVRNFGYMELDMRHLVFSGRGVLHNFGELVVLVNSSGPEDPATVRSTGRGNAIINGASGRITFRFIASGGSLHIGVPIDNRGSITMAPNGILVVSDLSLPSGSSLHLLHYSLVVVHKGRLNGLVTTTAESELRLVGDVALRRTTLQGLGVLSVLAGSCTFDNVVCDSGMEIILDGMSSAISKSEVSVEADDDARAVVAVIIAGSSVFGRDTRCMMRGVDLQSADNLANLIFEGKLVCHVPSVSFGSNIVVQANLAAVMFGDGEDMTSAQRTKLIPQRMPLNSSFVVPPNATLVIMDTGNLTQSAIDTLKSSPRICSTYVVVPMHVEVDGTVLLWGCAMLPVGATLNGVIYGTNAREIEATVEYAFCRNVLLNPRVCVPLFNQYQHENTPISGMTVSGSLAVAKLPPSGIRHPISISSPSPSINLQYFGLEDASLIAHDVFTLLAYKRIDIDASSTLLLTKGGLFGTSVLNLAGSLGLKGDLPLVLHGTLEVGPSGSITIDVDTDMCRLPLEVSEAITFHPDSQLRCFTSANRTIGSAGMIAYGDMNGLPRLDAATCALNGREVAVVITGSKDKMGIQFEDTTDIPNSKQRGAYFSTAVVMAFFVLCFLGLVMDLSTTKMLAELKKECALQLHLSWPEFSSYAANTVVVAGFLMEAAFLSMPAYHASLPLPLEIGYFTRSSMSFMLPHRNPSAPMFTAFSVILVGIWFMLWIPLTGKRLSHMIKNLVSHSDSPLQRKLIQLLFQSHAMLSFIMSLIMFPILTHLLEGVACTSFFSHIGACEDIAPIGTMCAVAAVMFIALVPYSANCLNFPFGHPPYHQTLDVRFKRSFSVLHSVIVFLQVASWKIFANDPVTLLFVSAALVSTLAALIWRFRPCAYGNINTMRLVSLSIPMWAIIAGLVQVARFGPHSKFVCAAGDPMYVTLLFVGKTVLTVVAVYSIRRCSSDYDSLSNDPAVDASMKALTLTYYQIEDLRVEMYNTTRTTRREVISNNIARLRIEYLEKLRMFRIAKERYLLPYYLGEGARNQHSSSHSHSNQSGHHSSSSHQSHHHGGDFSEDEMLSMHPNAGFAIPQDPVKPQFTTTGGSPLDPHAAGSPNAPILGEGLGETPADWILNPDEMDRFHLGPQLGRGSYGTVHMGMLPSGKLVAVKVIQIVRKKKDQLNAVKLEVNMLRSLTHPNIIRYFGCHATQGQMQVFMEFAVGGSLTSLVRKFEKLSEPVMRYYTQQILSGLQFLHTRHVVHRDIKGENILIDGHGVAKLADFGCSKGLADIANKSQNGCGTLVGSPYWMAPEVIKNEAYGTKADIWSVGCTVVEMLNGGHPPWHEKFDNVYSAMFFIASTSEIPSNIPNDVSDICKDFLARCFERDVTKRASAADLLIHPWLQDLASSGGGSGSDSSGTPKVERQWSDMFESDSNRGTTSNTSTHTKTAANTCTPAGTASFAPPEDNDGTIPRERSDGGDSPLPSSNATFTAQQSTFL